MQELRFSLYRIRKELCPSHAFTLIWAVVIFYATCQHIRYEYYLAVPVAILAGIAVGFALDIIRLPFGQKPEISPMDEDHQSGKKKAGKSHDVSRGRSGHPAGSVKAGSYLFLAIIPILVHPILISGGPELS